MDVELPLDRGESESPESKINHMLTCLAIGLMRQDAAIRAETSRPVTHLDEYLQWGWDQLAALCLLHGVSPHEIPRHLSDLVSWLHTPVEKWPGVGALLHDPTLTGPLLTHGIPSELCIELDQDMHEAVDPDRELGDLPFKKILDLCRDGQLDEEFNPAEQYTQARLFVATHPFLPEGTVPTISSDAQWAPEIRKLLRECYEPIPRASLRYINDKPCIARCPRCGWVLQWTHSEPKRASCYTPLCRDQSPLLDFPETWIPVEPDIAMQVNRGIQASVSGPESPLLHLYTQLTQELGLHCELWPAVDAIDLLVFLSDGERWGADMKDYSRATRLAITLSGRPFPATPSFDPTQDRAFYLFPDHRKTPGYKRAFLAWWTRPRGQHIEVAYASDFFQRVRQHEEKTNG